MLGGGAKDTGSSFKSKDSAKQIEPAWDRCRSHCIVTPVARLATLDHMDCDPDCCLKKSGHSFSDETE